MGAVRDIMNELRRRGATVWEWSGWDGRGNAGVSQINPVGAVLHHTASGYGSAFQVLVTGRSDLPGALCNFSGNSDGSFTAIASGLAYHAGQGAGPSLGPLASVAGNMNGRTVGLEIVYPGNTPMTQAQYDSMILFGRVVADLFAGGNADVIRAHAETNGWPGDGKWDPGFAPGQTINMDTVRNLIRNYSGPVSPAPQPEDDNVALLAHNIEPVKDVWSSIAVPPVRGSLSSPAAGGETWLHLHAPNTAAKVEVWRSASGEGTLLKTFTVVPDAYVSVKLPDGTTGLSFRYLEGTQAVAATLETYRP